MNNYPLYDLYESKISQANAGDVAASIWLLNDFIASVKSNRQKNGKPHVGPDGMHTKLYEPMLDYFVERFSEILDGVSADKALGINKGAPGRGKLPRKLDRDTELVLAILDEICSAPGMQKGAAKIAVSKKMKVGIETVNNAWKSKSAKLAAELIQRLRRES